MRDSVNNLAYRTALAYAATTAPRTGLVIDVRGFDSAAIVVNVGAITTASATHYFTYDLWHGDLVSGTDAVVVPAVDRINAATAVNATTFADKPAVAFGYLGNKRYIHVREAEEGTASIVAGATAVLGSAASAPVTSVA